MQQTHVDTTSNPADAEVHDVVVVGARCAGSATAMLLARLGHDVVVLDRATFPSDTISTHAIARSGVVQLRRWGLLGQVVESGAPAIRRVSFHTPDGVTTKTVKDRAGVDFLVAPRRHALDTILVDAAVADGAKVRTGVTVTDVARDAAGRVVGVTGHDASGTPTSVRGRFVVGADGLRSRIARAVDAQLTDERHHHGAIHYTYVAGLDASGIEFHLADGMLAGVFPTNDGEANVWIGGRTGTIGSLGEGEARSRAFLECVARASSVLAGRVRAAQQTAPVHGFPGMPNQVRHPVGPGWALVGDAGYFRDAVTGSGISDAFRDAERLATALDGALRGELDEGAALAGYHADRDGDIAELFELTCRLADYPPVREFVELQKRLSRTVEQEALRLAARPPVAPRVGVRAG